LTEDLSDLVLRAAKGEATAFEVLISRFERSALAVAYAQLKDADRAGDAVQEAFLRAWQELPKLKEAARFAGWLMQIVRNAAIDLRRRIKPTVEFPEWEAAKPDVDPVAISLAAESAERVKEALDTLDETTRAAVMLRYYEGLPAKEIAVLLEMSPAAVDMRLSRARGQLREQLADMVDAELPRVGDR